MSKELEWRLGDEIARVRHGQDVTASDLANRLMPFIVELQRAAAEKAWDAADSAFEDAHKADMLEPWGHLYDNPFRKESE